MSFSVGQPAEVPVPSPDPSPNGGLLSGFLYTDCDALFKGCPAMTVTAFFILL